MYCTYYTWIHTVCICIVLVLYPTGEYDICLDNSFSTFSEKTVYLAIYIYRKGEDEFGDLFDEEDLREQLEEEAEVRVEIMKVCILP